MRRASLLLLMPTFLLATACSTDTTVDKTRVDAGSSSATAKDAGKTTRDADPGASESPNADGDDDGEDQSDDGRPAAPGDQTPDTAAKQQLPCDVKAVLEKNCVSCHAADEPQFGAPMSLASVEDFQGDAPKAKSANYLAAADRIQRDGAGAMPPSGQAPLSEADKAILLAWLEAKAPASDGKAACEGTTKPDDGKGEEVAVGECDESFELRAHNTDAANKDDKFPIPQEDDHYECFYFKANLDPKTLATSLSPLLDDTRVLHHWLLFAADNQDEAPSGTHARCDGVHPGAFLMAAWLPGTPALVMPEGVGMEFPKGDDVQLILENHYNNTARYQDASDNSGVKVCTTTKPKAQHAGMHWLGSETITLAPMSNGSTEATCTPGSDEPIHIMGVIPHMHKLGKHVTMTVMRKDGTTEKLHEGSFEFENQTYYPKQLVLNPGDRVHTKCDYENNTRSTVTLGENTTNEMCYMFTLAYPVGRMATGGNFLNPFTGEAYVQGPNRCML